MTQVYNRLDIILPNLRHFQQYSIEVLACQEYDPLKENKLCSDRAIITATTLPDPKADNINHRNVTIKNQTNHGIFISWVDPPDPNGLIVTYEIEYKLDLPDIKPYPICIPHKQYRAKGGYILTQLNPGNYTFRIRATSLAGNGTWTKRMSFFVADPRVIENNFWKIEVIVLIAVASFLCILLAFAGGLCFFAKKRYGPGNVTISANPGYFDLDGVYSPDQWEVERKKVDLIKALGQGSFGMVYEGIAKNLIEGFNETKVAVKTVNDNASVAERLEFLKEASVMKAFNSNHVVKLLGVVSKGQPTYVIMELMGNGDLKNFLRQHRPDDPENKTNKQLSLKRILQMAGEIADGMAYLAAKKFVHRDLAARNCMVGTDLTCKIGDFGMTRDVYDTDYYRKGGKGPLPVRWMAPESMKDGIFSSMSDVWSYGVVVWEMVTLAAQPYQGLSNEQVLKFVIDGGLMEKPERCPEKMFNIMTRCWSYHSNNRPTFLNIIEYLVPDLDEKFTKVSFFFSEDNVGDVEDDENGRGMFEENLLLHSGRQSSDTNISINDLKTAFERDKNSSCDNGDAHRPCECMDNFTDSTTYKKYPFNSSRSDSNHSGAIESRGGTCSTTSDESKGSNQSYANGIVNGHAYPKRTTQC